MITAGLKYGCITTAEVTIFLQVLDDPTTIFYFLSDLKTDVGTITGWKPNFSGENRLHLTAIGQMIMFTLRALMDTPQSQDWRNRAVQQLKIWEIAYEDVLDEIVTPSSEYRLSKQQKSEIKPRSKSSRIEASCRPQEDQNHSSKEEPDPSYRKTVSAQQESRAQTSN